MPFDTMLVIAAVMSMFVAFAGVLIWGHVQTRPERLKPSDLLSNAAAAKPHRRILLRSALEIPLGDMVEGFPIGCRKEFQIFRFYRFIRRRTLRFMRSVIARIDLEYFPGSCCL
jgi:hypothetical protein